ncbi:K+ channel tetramerization subfamily protein [Acanthamoeba castellanii str. Neff]|uniref:K+ channel tetramerisation subfamily protein n=1 Tax=Acanthamoeba castellanii (strain ATCC 30010 / Neff) TaxID=1257118 RepID=M0QSN4_ACACF|nr:K+ channel tetramerization subfamily protein [Acanthamoeba castellanii str. Neff]ELR17059.1 K+ channel tetramerisation subfamily protein [Acanthamoeba castellanii str. Neff]
MTRAMLGDLFEHLSVTKQPHGWFFIDRDGKLFCYVLQFLCDGDIRDMIAGMKVTDIMGLKREAFFFDLGSLKEQISEVESAIV